MSLFKEYENSWTSIEIDFNLKNNLDLFIESERETFEQIKESIMANKPTLDFIHKIDYATYHALVFALILTTQKHSFHIRTILQSINCYDKEMYGYFLKNILTNRDVKSIIDTPTTKLLKTLVTL
ncbi:MAG: hypothetical protein ABIM30_01290 [candidate division WOR-3 bacterium]